MALFRPYERSEGEPKQPEPTSEVTGDPAKPAKKAVPTPSRRDAEAARRERLNPTLSPKEARARERAARSALRDERFSKAEATPGKVLLRDFVDSHRGLAQWAMPILMITLAVSLFISSVSAEAAITVTTATYAVFVLIAIDLFRMWRRFKQLAAERIPNVPLKGLLSYMISRAINLRRLRMPAPRVKPGDKI